VHIPRPRWVPCADPNPPPPSPPTVQHEEPGAGAALLRVQGHRQAARGAAMPAQRVPHVCLGGLSGKRLPASRPPPRAQLPGLHAQHPLTTPGPEADP